MYSGVSKAGQPRLWQHRFREFYESPVTPPYEAILTENGQELTTESGQALEITIGMYVDELDNQIITEDGNEWEVE